MKLVNIVEIKGHFENGEQWRARRAICIDKFKSKGGDSECVKVLKVCDGVSFPDSEFTPLYDERGRVAAIQK